MIYDVEKVLDFTGEEPEWKYRVTLSARELDELEALASLAAAVATDHGFKPTPRLEGIRQAFAGLARQLSRGRDLDSIDNFKVNRPLPVPAIRNRNLDCE